MTTAVATNPPCLTAHSEFSELGEAFYTRVSAVPVPDPYWVVQSASAAQAMACDTDWLASRQALEVFSGHAQWGGEQPLATVYSGHQFGVWAGQLGDGRALLLGETPQGQQVQIKGSGRTPYSRGADGRAVLRSSIREFLVSEAMHALGIPTTRALCVVGSDLPVQREEVETAAVTTRLSPSFIRFGHFEHFSYSGQHDELKQLADFVIDRFYPECRGAAQPYTALLEAVTRRTAALIAQWQAIGFMHGVMNTDNMSILGLTLDYGPFQFMDAFDPAHICNHSDTLGRYAYQNQPGIAYWNLRALGHALLPLIKDQERVQNTTRVYETAFAEAIATRMAAKLGFAGATSQSNQLVTDLLALMARERTDYTIFWRRLSQHMAGSGGDHPVHDLFLDRPAIDAWLLDYETLAAQGTSSHDPALMRASNPAIVLRNHMAEQAIARAKLKDFSLLEELLSALEHPHDEPTGHPEWTQFPPDWASRIQVSCSS